MAVVVPVRTGATEGRPELYPEHVSRACRGIVEWVYNLLLNAALVLSSSKEFTLSIVEGPSTISYSMVPGRALSPPGAFWLLGKDLRKGNTNGGDHS